MNMLKLNKVVRWEKWLVWLFFVFVCATVRVINKVTYFSAKERHSDISITWLVFWIIVLDTSQIF